MLNIAEVQPGLYEMTLSGLVERADVARAREELAPVLAGEGRIGLVVRVEELSDMAADALAGEGRFEFGKLTKLRKIARLALVTDKQAFEALMRWTSPVVPTVDMASFASAALEEARAWAGDLPQGVAPGSEGVRMLSDGNDGVLGFEIIGRVSKSDTDSVFAQFERATAGDRPVNLLVRFGETRGFDMSLLTDSGLIGTKLRAMGHVRRYAVIGAPGLIRSAIRVADAMSAIDYRHFDASEEAEAWQWVGTGSLPG